MGSKADAWNEQERKLRQSSQPKNKKTDHELLVMARTRDRGGMTEQTSIISYNMANTAKSPHLAS